MRTRRPLTCTVRVAALIGALILAKPTWDPSMSRYDEESIWAKYHYRCPVCGEIVHSRKIKNPPPKCPHPDKHGRTELLEPS